LRTNQLATSGTTCLKRSTYQEDVGETAKSSHQALQTWGTKRWLSNIKNVSLAICQIAGRFFSRRATIGHLASKRWRRRHRPSTLLCIVFLPRRTSSACRLTRKTGGMMKASWTRRFSRNESPGGSVWPCPRHARSKPGTPTFRAGKKMFAACGGKPGDMTLGMKMSFARQDELLKTTDSFPPPTRRRQAGYRCGLTPGPMDRDREVAPRGISAGGE